MPFDLNTPQRAIYADKVDQQQRLGRSRQYMLKARQPGGTTYAQADNLHVIWGRRGRDCMTLAHSQEATGKIFEITRRAVENFPESLLPEMGAKDTMEISFPSRDSHFWTGTAGQKVAGRSITLTQLHLSEFALYADPMKVLGGFLPAMEKVPGSHILIETTPSDFDGPAHRLWRSARDGRSEFRALFFPWWKCDPRYSAALVEPDELGALSDAEKALIAGQGLSLEQIKWRRKMIANYEGSLADFLQHYPEDDEGCWLAPGAKYYNADLLRMLMEIAAEPTALELGGTLRLFGEHDKTQRVIIGADVAQGLAQDRTTAIARQMGGWKLLAEYADSRVTAKDFARHLADMGRRFARGADEPALLVVEKNDHGLTVLRELRDELGYPVHHIYHRETLDRAHHGSTERIGWQTTGPVIPLMLDAGEELLQAVKDGIASVPSADMIRDALRVHRDDTGKISLNGKDLLVAEILAWIGRRVPSRGEWGSV